MVLVFFFFALVFATFYGIKGDEIYGTTPKAAPAKDKKAKDKKEKDSVHWAIRWDLYLQRFFGVFFGWMMMWWLLEKQLDVFCHHHPIPHVEFIHVLVFFVALIGIFGRLPQLVHNVISLIGWRNSK